MSSSLGFSGRANGRDGYLNREGVGLTRDDSFKYDDIVRGDPESGNGGNPLCETTSSSTGFMNLVRSQYLRRRSAPLAVSAAERVGMLDKEGNYGSIGSSESSPKDTIYEESSGRPNAIKNFIDQIPPVIIVSILNFLVGIPFGVAYFPVEWSSQMDADEEDEDVHGGEWVLQPLKRYGIFDFGVQLSSNSLQLSWTSSTLR